MASLCLDPLCYTTSWDSTRLARLMSFPWYRRFFTFHCYFWYALGISVGAHAYVAWTTYGFPFR